MNIIESKLIIIIYSKEHTKKEACNKFFVPNSMLGGWKLKKTTLNKGVSILYPNLEIQLINFIEFNRILFNCITT